MSKEKFSLLIFIIVLIIVMFLINNKNSKDDIENNTDFVEEELETDVRAYDQFPLDDIYEINPNYNPDPTGQSYQNRNIESLEKH